MPVEESLTLKLSSSKAKSVTGMVLDGVDEVRQGRSRFDEKSAAWWARYELQAPKRKVPFAQAANLRTNLTQWVIDTTWVRALRTTAGQDPYLRIVDEVLGSGPDQQPLERLVQHLAITDLALRFSWAQIYLGAFVDGTGIAKLVRRNGARTVRDWETDQTNGERLLVERTVNERPGLGLDVLDLKDFWVANASISDLNRQPWVAHRVWLRWDDIVRRQRDGIYRVTKAQLSKIKGLSKSRRTTINYSNDQVKSELDLADEAGWSPNDEYEAFECEWRYDVDGDGLEEECLFTVLADWRDAPLRAEHFTFWNGYRNYLAYRPLPRQNRFYGRSLAGIMQMLQDEADLTQNMSLDATALDILAGLTPILSRGMKTTWERHKWDLGKAIFVDVPENFQTLRSKMGHDIQKSEVQLNRIFALAERASGISDTQLGKPSEGDKTAFEIQQVSQEGNIKFAEMIAHLQETNRELGYQTLEHAYQLAQESPEFRARIIKACGADPFAETDLRALRQRVDVQPTGNSANSNQDLVAKKWGTVYQNFAQDPFVLQDKTREWYLRNQVLQAMGLSKEAELIIGTQEQAQQMQEQAEQQQQAQQALQGVMAGYEIGKALDPSAPQAPQNDKQVVPAG